jgi:methylphosphotriester-DNA--protein-cysteine methyltransferase
MHYLAQWRMQVAAQKLRDSGASLAQVAELVGYESEAAFSRAFKKTGPLRRPGGAATILRWIRHIAPPGSAFRS